jgi:ATP-dependent RNA circularization protein (DNA/RNA ligase family)
MISKKFPRIPHLPWSPGGTPDDDRLVISDYFINACMLGCNRIVITEKMDGANVCLTHDDVFSRSHSGPPTHKMFDSLKQLHSQIRHDIMPGLSIFGEWCYAQNCIHYDNLPGYLLLFAVREDENGYFLSREELEVIACDLDIPVVPLLFDGNVEGSFETLTNVLGSGASLYGEEREGIVVWPFYETGTVDQSTAKWVKAGHHNNDDDWLRKPIIKQGLARGASGLFLSK